MTINVDLKGGDLTIMTFSIAAINETRQVPEELITFPVSNLPTGLRTALKGQVVKRDSIKPFDKYRKQMEEYLFLRALKTDFGYVLNPRKLREIGVFVSDLNKKVDELVESFIEGYDDNCLEVDNELREEYKDFSHTEEVIAAIQKCRPTKQYLHDQLGMTVSFGKVGVIEAIDPELDDVLQCGQAALRKGLWGQLLVRVTDRARKQLNNLSKNQANGKGSVVQKSVISARKTLELLDNMAFIDGRVYALRDLLEKAFDTLPKEGTLVGRDADDFRNILKACSDELHIQWCLEQNQPLLKIEAKPSAEGMAQSVEELTNPAQPSLGLAFSV